MQKLFLDIASTLLLWHFWSSFDSLLECPPYVLNVSKKKQLLVRQFLLAGLNNGKNHSAACVQEESGSATEHVWPPALDTLSGCSERESEHHQGAPKVCNSKI